MRENLSRLFREGYDAYHGGDYELAAQKIRYYAHKLPHETNHEPYYWLGKCFIEMNDLDAAVGALKTYVSGCGCQHGAKVLKEFGLEMRERGHYVHGKAVLTMAVELDPNIGLKTLLKSI